MPATLIRLGYGKPVSGVYPAFIDLVYPAWQLRDGAGYVNQTGRRESRIPVAGGTLVQGLGRLPRTHNIDLLYRPRLRASATGAALPVWDDVLESMEDELLEQRIGFFWGDRFKGRCILANLTWSLKDAGYVQDTNTAHGGFFAREVDVNLKLTRLLDEDG